MALSLGCQEGAYFSCSCNKHSDQNQPGEERAPFIHASGSQATIEGSGAWAQAVTEVETSEASSLLAPSDAVSYLLSPGPPA